MFWNCHSEAPSTPLVKDNIMGREEFFSKYMREEVTLVDTSQKMTEVWKEIGEDAIWYSPTESVEFGFIGKRRNFVFVDVTKMEWLTVEEHDDAIMYGFILLANTMYVRGLITAYERDQKIAEFYRMNDETYNLDETNISRMTDTEQCHYYARQCGWDPDE